MGLTSSGLKGSELTRAYYMFSGLGRASGLKSLGPQGLWSKGFRVLVQGVIWILASTCGHFLIVS